MSFDESGEVVVAVGVVDGEIAAATFGILVVCGRHGFFIPGRVEFVGGFVNFIGLAVFLRLE